MNFPNAKSGVFYQGIERQYQSGLYESEIDF